MQNQEWNNELEKEFKNTIHQYFDEKINNELNSKNVLQVGDNLGQLLKDSEEDIVKIITPRAVKKWASPETLPLWEKFLKNEQMILELREIGKSIANSMRPLAGNNFAIWVTKVLNKAFEIEKLPITASTTGEAKKALNKAIDEFSKSNKSFKPDIDIVVVKSEKIEVIAIISAKTTLAERVMQTISWSNYLQTLPKDIQKIKLFLVTAWEVFDKESVNKERVQQLDGVYVCSPDVKEYGNIKKFSKIIDDLKELL
jgi:hypothetical protein